MRFAGVLFSFSVLCLSVENEVLKKKEKKDIKLCLIIEVNFLNQQFESKQNKLASKRRRLQLERYEQGGSDFFFLPIHSFVV